jgi:hypothetical protein
MVIRKSLDCAGVKALLSTFTRDICPATAVTVPKLVKPIVLVPVIPKVTVLLATAIDEPSLASFA